jgi:hypothetical protein
MCNGAQRQWGSLIGEDARAGLDPAFRVAGNRAVAPILLADGERLGAPENHRQNETRAAKHDASSSSHGELQS